MGKFFKILVSSRDEVDIRGVLSDVPRMRLEASSACLDRDIDNYISHRLDNDREFKWLKPSLQQIIRERLDTKAKGIQALDCLPRSLQETCEKILEKVDPGCVDAVRQTLHWLVCDVSPFTFAELYESLAIEQDMDHIDEEAQLSGPVDIYDMCGSLIAFTAEGEVILAHLSVKDYLLSDSIKHGKASAFSVSAPEANAENAFRSDDFEVRLLNHPSLEHASTYWPSYAENAGSSCDEPKARILEFFTSPCRPQFMSWLQAICSERRKTGYNSYPKHATPLYYAASFGIEHVVKALLEQGAEVDAMAALPGHVKVMDILFQNGADPNKSDSIKKTPLNSAALGGNVEVVKYLLGHGADPDIIDELNKTAYDWLVGWGMSKQGKCWNPRWWERVRTLRAVIVRSGPNRCSLGVQQAQLG
ncbi:hypothetical protein BGZ57DRAFT_944325 [Hyaloscypha finlandica]|nr:hypothetical protein BGZ57DRAFT_944325 [Hyaloscypha finlandica]